MEPKYVLRFLRDYGDGLYFSEDHRWQGVTKDQATRYTFKEARAMRDRLYAPGLRLVVIPELLDRNNT